MSLALEWKEQAHPASEREERRDLAAEVKRERKSAREKRRLRLTFLCFLCVAAFVSGLLILTICLHVMVVQNDLKVREIEREIELERRKHEAMRVEIASLESPSRIESIAVDELKMVQVAQAEYLETASYQAAKTREADKAQHEEAMVSSATQGRP